MSVTLNDILLQVDDYNQNYTVSTIDRGNKIRAVNRAIEYVQRRMGLPSDRKIFSFYYYSDVQFYDAPDAFNEPIQLYYNTQRTNVENDKNKNRNRWLLAQDIEILRSSAVQQSYNRFAFTTINGENQLLMNGRNIVEPILLNPFDSTDGLMFSASISNEVVDNNIKRVGSGSIKFDLDNSESTSSIVLPGTFDIRNQLNQNGKARIYMFLPTGGPAQITSIAVKFQSSVGNYYTLTATVQEDGSAFTANGWSFVSFDFSTAVTTGSPDATSVTPTIQINHSGSFTAISNMRLNYLYTIIPDYMDLVYYSAYKGTDSTGTTEKIILNEEEDLCSFGDYAPDLLLPIALKAAVILWPQLRADPNFMEVYRADFMDTLKVYGRTYPRNRAVTLGKTQLLR